MIAANLPVSKDCCNNVLKPVNTFGQKKLDLNLWRESLASHPSLDILIFVLGRSKPGQKCVFFRRQRRKTKIRLLHFGILRQRAVDPGQRKPGRQPPAPLGLGKVVSVHPRPAWLGSPLHIQSSNTHYTYLWCANHPGFLIQKGPSDVLIKICWQRWASLVSKDIDPLRWGWEKVTEKGWQVSSLCVHVYPKASGWFFMVFGGFWMVYGWWLWASLGGFPWFLDYVFFVCFWLVFYGWWWFLAIFIVFHYFFVGFGLFLSDPGIPGVRSMGPECL